MVASEHIRRRPQLIFSEEKDIEHNQGEDNDCAKLHDTETVESNGIILLVKHIQSNCAEDTKSEKRDSDDNHHFQQLLQCFSLIKII